MADILQQLINHPLYDTRSAGSPYESASGLSPQMVQLALALVKANNPGLTQLPSGANQLEVMPGQTGPRRGLFGMGRIGFPDVAGGSGAYPSLDPVY